MTAAYSAIIFIGVAIAIAVGVLLFPTFELLQVAIAGLFGWILRLGRSPAPQPTSEGVWTEEMERREEVNTNEERPLYQAHETRGAGGVIALVFILVLLIAFILRVSGIWS